MRRLLDRWLPAYAFLYIVFLYLPVIFLPIFSINTSPVPQFPLSGYTLKWYEELPRTQALLDAAWNSLLVGVVCIDSRDRAWNLCGARHHALPISRPPADQWADHGAAGPAGNHRRDLAAAGAAAHGARTIALLGRAGPRFDLRSLLDQRPDLRLRRLRPQPRRGFGRSWRVSVRHVPASHAANGDAGHHLVAAGAPSRFRSTTSSSPSSWPAPKPPCPSTSGASYAFRQNCLACLRLARCC